MTDRRLDAARAFYASLVAGQSGAAPELRERMERAFALVPREHFLGPPPWAALTGLRGVIETSDPIHLYQNVLVAIDRARGVNNGEPCLHGQLIAALHPQRGERALHIGCGTGYYTAILATLVAPDGRVTGYEILDDLASAAARNLAPWENADVIAGSGADAALPAADMIYVSAGSTRPADAWLDALVDGGRLVFPLIGAKRDGVALLVSRRGVAFDATVISRVSFITCAGAFDAEEGAAVDRGVKRLRRGEALTLLRDGGESEASIVAGHRWRLVARG
ncbi:MAG: hypothetical protein BGP06_11935 [Rhizobiales bacterium 65-9]|nr:SAM-dependent methyltransferase [Hyphomicrobiales bacterium]OJY34039.1 MAG: hypothetical protein BGP06_11935 [Rhizobiales bacterium 65-9]